MQAKTKALACQQLQLQQQQQPQQQLEEILSTQQIIKAVEIGKLFLVGCASHSLHRLPLTRFRFVSVFFRFSFFRFGFCDFLSTKVIFFRLSKVSNLLLANALAS